VEIDRQPFTVVGIMPRSFSFPFEGTPFSQPAELWIPMALTQDEIRSANASFGISVIARLKQGITVSQASDDTATIISAFHQDHPELNTRAFQITASAVSLPGLLM